ncbi:MAG: hypothetical protein Q7U33_02515 [Methylotenera sp.]|uniref:hypothetical protein n=1 Tax=Methylotenera sp. TaxID=2051956 RepID=UPI0027214A0A|nr:hypothetical protein [Methylotenera sp.]MDO9150235.1 hypothetical protein [Methylotenera sp.]
MLGEFKWSLKVAAWLAFTLLVFAVISYNIPEHPTPNETVLLPGYQFIDYAMYLIGIAMLLAIIRKRKIILNFEVNLLEGLIALSGAALFISPFAALLVKFLSQVIANANT